MITVKYSGDLAPIQHNTMREKIMHLQNIMVNIESSLDKCILKHTFSKGVYARQMTIPKDIVIIGKIHIHSHLNIISRGRVLVVTEFGEMEIDATNEPYTFTSNAGTKRVVYALDETVWTTIHLTNETDLDKIEHEIIAKDFKEYDLLSNKIKELL